MFPTAETQSQILDLLCVHGVYVDNTDLIPLNPTDDSHSEAYNVLKASTHVEDGFLFLPYDFTAYGLEIQMLHWNHTGAVTGSYKVFPLDRPSEFPSIVSQVLDLLSEKGQQFE